MCKSWKIYRLILLHCALCQLSQVGRFCHLINTVFMNLIRNLVQLGKLLTYQLQYYHIRTSSSYCNLLPNASCDQMSTRWHLHNSCGHDQLRTSPRCKGKSKSQTGSAHLMSDSYYSIMNIWDSTMAFFLVIRARSWTISTVDVAELHEIHFYLHNM